MSDPLNSIIIDVGSSYTKVGMSSDEAPLSIFDTAIGRPRKGLSADQETQLLQSYYVGKEALDLRQLLTVKRPVEHGIVTNWEDWTDLVRYALDRRLCVDPSEHPVVLCEPVLNPRMNREKSLQIMFEEFVVPGLFLGSDAVFSFGSFRPSPATVDATEGTSESLTGLLVDLGAGGVQATPIYYDHFLAHCVPHATIGAREVLSYFAKLVSSSEYRFETSADLDLLQKPMTESWFVSKDFDCDMARPESEFELKHTLENGRELVVGKGRFQCAEMLFKPKLFDYEMPSIVDVISRAISLCNPSLRDQLRSNIVLAGGMSSIPGLSARLETSSLESEGWTRVRVHQHPTHSAWLGAKMTANGSNFEASLIMKEEYDEYGPSIVRNYVCK